MQYPVSAQTTESIRCLLSQGPHGTIRMVNSAGVYIQLGEQIILLCDQKWGLVPIGISIPDFESQVRQLRLSPDQSVFAAPDALRFPGGILSFHFIKSKLPAPTAYIPQVDCCETAARQLITLNKQRGLSLLAAPLLLCTPMPDLMSDNPYCRRACSLLSELMESLKQRQNPDFPPLLRHLLGLGIGLTPSADDVLLGMLFVFRYAPASKRPVLDAFRQTVADLAGQCTNQISGAYLNAILSGAPFERMAQVWAGLCGQIPLSIEPLTQIGSNSGAEMLLGMLLAIRSCFFTSDVL